MTSDFLQYKVTWLDKFEAAHNERGCPKCCTPLTLLKILRIVLWPFHTMQSSFCNGHFPSTASRENHLCTAESVSWWHAKKTHRLGGLRCSMFQRLQHIPSNISLFSLMSFMNFKKWHLPRNCSRMTLIERHWRMGHLKAPAVHRRTFTLSFKSFLNINMQI